MARVLFIAGNARSLLANRGDLIKRLKKYGHHVMALVPAYDVLPELKDLGISYELTQMRRSSLHPWHDLRLVVEFRNKIRLTLPDVVFSYTIKPVIYGSLAARWAGAPVITSMITGLGFLFTGDSFKQRLARLIAMSLYKLALPLNQVVFFQNPDDRKLFQQKGLLRSGQKTVIVNGSGINLERFAPAPLPDGPPRFLLIARLLQDKGIAEFVAAANSLKLAYPEIEFEVLGPHDPNLKHALSINQLESWQAAGQVTFHPPVKDVRPYLARCSVYVLPSYREGTPRSVLEAMAMGRPVITTDVPGCRETVIPGVNGFLIPARNAEALAEAMRQFIVQPDLIARMGHESRQIAEKKYDVKLVNAMIMQHMLGES